MRRIGESHVMISTTEWLAPVADPVEAFVAPLTPNYGIRMHGVSRRHRAVVYTVDLLGNTPASIQKIWIDDPGENRYYGVMT